MSTSPVSATVRLTARGRLLLGASGLVVALSLISATTAVGDAGAAAGIRAGSSAGYETVRVLPGESLWSIARELAPAMSMATGDVVAMIVDINNLDSAELQSGQELLIPQR